MTLSGETQMASGPIEYNNPAGRLYQILSNLTQTNSNAVQMVQFAKHLGVEENWDAILNGIMDLKREYNVLESIIDSNKDNNTAKYTLWSKNLKDIKISVDSFSCNMPNKNCQMAVIPSAVVALQFIAADLPMEEEVSVDELEQLRKLCDELRKEILEAEDVPKALREWLLDLVRLMRDAIDRYKIRGSRGLRRQLHEMVGSLMDHQEFAEETNRKSPTIWLKVMEGLESLNKMAQHTETAVKAIGYVKKAIEFFSGGSSTPPMSS
jgi:hypothetical protein